MVQSITNNLQSYNTYSSYKRAKNVPKYGINYSPIQTSFKGSTLSIRKSQILTSTLALIGGIASFLGINKNQPDFEKYFEEISKMPPKTFENGELVQNKNLIPYAEMLDNLNTKQKKKFVKVFCEKTGFPDLAKVQNIMDEEIKRAIYTSMEGSGIKPVFAAYTSSCSLGRASALPGSDCDGLFIVTDKPFNLVYLNRATIGNEINQRLLDTQGMHYPELFSINELLPFVELSNIIFEKIKTPQKIENYKNNLKRNDQDFIKAGEFNLDIAAKIKKDSIKNMMYLTGMFVEELRAGHILINNIDKKTLDKIQNSALYKYSNVVRQEGFQDNVKPKWENRKKMASEFNSMSDDEKFEICSEILKSSMGIQKPNPSKCYEDFEMGNILELIDKLTTFRQFMK